MNTEDSKLARRAKQIIGKLERLSVDSSYAHQASGLRRAIIRGLDTRKERGMFPDPVWMCSLVERGEVILIEAARQIPESD